MHFRRSFSRLNVARNSVASSRRLCRERFCGAPLLLLFLLLLVLPLSIARVGLPTGRREEAVEKSPRNARRRPGLSAVHAAPQIRTDRFPVVSAFSHLPHATPYSSIIARPLDASSGLRSRREAPDHCSDERCFESATLSVLLAS